MSEKREFVELALAPGANVSQLCLRYGITRRTGYKWIRRVQQDGFEALQEHSRKPHHCPTQTSAALEALVLQVREKYPTWGARKIHRVLVTSEHALVTSEHALVTQGHSALPAPSTISAILKRHGKITPDQSRTHHAWQRFEYPEPNDLWQMDYKGHFPLLQGRCHPLTVLDDHSRFNLCLQACADERAETVQTALTQRFRLYGLPRKILTDNGAPWGTTGNTSAEHQTFSRLELWLMRLGILVCHGGPNHPQTQGKEERFHRTLKADLLHFENFSDLVYSQQRFDVFRQIYNHERPHEALGMAVPASRYQVSNRVFPEVLPALEYGSDDLVRRVQQGGDVRFLGYQISLCRALSGASIAFRAQVDEGCYDLFFAQHAIGSIDLRQLPKGSRVPSKQ